MEQPTLVTVRFLSARATLCGCHVAGVPYPVTPDFARQVVEVERVAEYVEEAAPEAQPAPAARKAKRR